MKRILTFIAGALMCILASAQVQNTSVVAINVPGDGSIVVRASGNSRNRVLARKQAAKLAVRAVIFDGVYVPDNPLISRPLITDMNGERKYEDFFNAFFADHGEYLKFVKKHKDRKFASNRVSQYEVQTGNIVTVRVERALLKQYLKENNIIQ